MEVCYPDYLRYLIREKKIYQSVHVANQSARNSIAWLLNNFEPRPLNPLWNIALKRTLRIVVKAYKTAFHFGDDAQYDWEQIIDDLQRIQKKSRKDRDWEVNHLELYALSTWQTTRKSGTYQMYVYSDSPIKQYLETWIGEF